MLGTLQIVIYLDINIDGLVGRFADDSTIRGVVGSEKCCQDIHQDTDQLQKWAGSLTRASVRCDTFRG